MKYTKPTLRVLYCIVLCCIVLYLLYCIYCIVLYCIVFTTTLMSFIDQHILMPTKCGKCVSM